MTTTMKLTPRQQRVYDALDGEWRNPTEIAGLIGAITAPAVDEAIHRCIELTRLGLAERMPINGGSVWCRAEAAQ